MSGSQALKLLQADTLRCRLPARPFETTNCFSEELAHSPTAHSTFNASQPYLLFSQHHSQLTRRFSPSYSFTRNDSSSGRIRTYTFTAPNTKLPLHLSRRSFTMPSPATKQRKIAIVGSRSVGKFTISYPSPYHENFSQYATRGVVMMPSPSQKNTTRPAK